MQADGMCRFLGTFLGFAAFAAVGIRCVMLGESMVMSVAKGIGAFVALSMVIGFFGGMVLSALVPGDGLDDGASSEDADKQSKAGPRAA